VDNISFVNSAKNDAKVTLDLGLSVSTKKTSAVAPADILVAPATTAEQKRE
jgi:hypothetical protein